MALKTLRAITTIELTVRPGKAGDNQKGIAPVRPVTKTIATGTFFKAQSEAQQKELVDMGAAREITSDEKPGEREIVSAPDAEKEAEATAEATETAPKRKAAQKTDSDGGLV